MPLLGATFVIYINFVEKLPMGKIILEGLEFYAYHGCFKEEQLIGGKYIIDLELSLDLSKAVKSDNLEDTINYSEVYTIAKQEMDKPSKLVEHVAGRIVESLFGTFSSLDAVVLKLSKMNPPVNGQMKSASVIIERRRKQ
jgi:7,8-dihydroneopterin aldolase/epimerase/oxygenase